MTEWKHADAFPPMWKPQEAGEFIIGEIVAISDEGQYGDMYKVKISVPTEITIKRNGTPKGETEVATIEKDEMITLANHVNLMGALEGRVSVGYMVNIKCTGVIPARHAGKNDTVTYDVQYALPTHQSKL